MKKNDVIFLLGAITYSILFYKQDPGLNFLLFTILVNGLLLVFNPEKRFDLQWWYFAALSIFTGCMVVCVNSALSIFSCVCSLLMLSGKTISRNNSVFLAFAFAVFSFFSSLVYWII